MMIATQPMTDSGLTLKPLLPSELASSVHLLHTWLWHGYLGHGKLTALISPPKSGKTTLLSHVLNRMSAGGQLAGLAVTPGRALVVSEESAPDWDARCQRLRLEANVQFVCRPFHRARPTDADWHTLVDGLVSLHRATPFDLIVLDALAALLPGSAEMCGPKLIDCLLPLQALAQEGPAIWLLHHPAKGKCVDGQASRGAGALNGFVDIIMELSHVRRARSGDRRRRLCGYSRYLETPRRQILELAEDGADYTLCKPEVPLHKPWQTVLDVLGRACEKYTQDKILSWWPKEIDQPHRTTLARWLQRAAEQNLICCSGAGHHGDAYLYWLPSRTALMHPGAAAGAKAIKAWRQRVDEDSRRRFLEELGISRAPRGAEANAAFEQTSSDDAESA